MLLQSNMSYSDECKNNTKDNGIQNMKYMEGNEQRKN